MMTPQEIMALIQQLQGGGNPATAASVPSSALPPGNSGGLSGVGGALTNLVGLGGGSTDTGDLVSGDLGKTALSVAPLTGPAAPFVGGAGALLSVLSSLGLFDFGGGLSKTAKTSALGTGLEAGGDPLGQLVGQYISGGAQAGHPLSDPSFGSSAEQVASMLQALTGKQISPFTLAPGQFEHPVSWSGPPQGRPGQQLPPGYQFLQETPQNLQTAYGDITKLVPYGGLSGPNFLGDWQKVVQQLIQQGVLTKSQTQTGAISQGSAGSPAGAFGPSASNSPNLTLPHPLAPQQNPLFPYPV